MVVVARHSPSTPASLAVASALRWSHVDPERFRGQRSRVCSGRSLSLNVRLAGSVTVTASLPPTNDCARVLKILWIPKLREARRRVVEHTELELEKVFRRRLFPA